MQGKTTKKNTEAAGPIKMDYNKSGNPAVDTVLTLYRFSPDQVREIPSLWEINRALDTGNNLIKENKYLQGEYERLAYLKNQVPGLELDLVNQKDANKILEHRLKNATDYSNKLEGWLHETARKANFTAGVLLIVSVIAIVNGALSLYFFFR